MGNEIIFCIIMLVLFIFPILVYAQVISINVAQFLDIQTSDPTYKKIVKNGEPFNLSLDIYNSGSVEYTARIRFEILKKNESIFVGWSNEQSLWPNSYAHYEVFWYPMNLSEKLTAKMRVYYANEIHEFKPINFEIKTYPSPNDPFKITYFKTYEDKVKFGLISNKDVKDIVIIPSDYPFSWMFEQNKLDSLSANKEKHIEIRYYPSIWKSTQVKINLIAENGKYFSSESFPMEKETDFFSYVSHVMKSILVMLKIYS